MNAKNAVPRILKSLRLFAAVCAGAVALSASLPANAAFVLSGGSPPGSLPSGNDFNSDLQGEGFSQAAIGTQVSNAFVGRVKMIVIQSGEAKANRWQSERRNLLADYRAAFNEDPPPVSGIAIMTDSDNTGGTASAWYGDIRLLKPAAVNTPPQ